MFRLLSFILLFSVHFTLLAQFQPLPYAKMVVDTLSCPYYEGRGYIREGDMKSAYFVANEMYKLNLKRFPLAPTFYQNFTFPVNTFPYPVFAALDNTYLNPGIEFVPSPACPAINGEFRLLWVDSALLHNDAAYKKFARQSFSDAFIVMDDKGIQDEASKKIFQNLGHNPFGAKGIIRIKDKIAWSVATDTLTFAQLDITRQTMLRSYKRIRLHVFNDFRANYKSQNVVTYIPGTEEPDSFIVFTAHYDHLGRIGHSVYFPGANDNASGVAMLLSLAQHYALKENKPKYSIVFIAFGAEEAGLIGSKRFSMYPVFPLEKIRLLINLDLMGGGEDGITIVNGKEHPRIMQLMQDINEEKHLLKAVKERSNAANSDHYYFAEAGIPAIFIYTMGSYKHYHDLYDQGGNLELTAFEQVFNMIVELSKRY